MPRPNQPQQESGLNQLIWPDCVPRQKKRFLDVNPSLIRYRTIVLGLCIVWLFLAIVLMTVLYAARRSVSVLLFNSLQGLVVTATLFSFLWVNFLGMLLALAGFSSMTGIIFLYVVIVTLVKEDGAYMLLHGSMLIAMDLPLCVVVARACWEYYNLLHKKRGVIPNDNQPEVIIIGQGYAENLAAAQAAGYSMRTNSMEGSMGVIGPGNVVVIGDGGGRLGSGSGSAAQAVPLPNDESLASVAPEEACPICLSRKRNIAIVPCGHLVSRRTLDGQNPDSESRRLVPSWIRRRLPPFPQVCQNCANQLCPGLQRPPASLQCPLCRKRVNQFQKIYL